MSTTSRLQIDQLLDELGSRIELAGLALDEEGAAQLAFDDIFVSLQLDEDNDQLLLTSPLGEPADDKAEAYGQLLDANFFWSKTAGATVARQPGSGIIFLQRALPVAGLEGAAFEAALQGFVDAAEALADGLDTIGTAVDEDEVPEIAIPPNGFIRG